jgi:hypothetical protein
MGRFKRQTFGQATGTVGQFVFRIKGDENIIARRPLKKVNPPPPPADIAARREKFKLTGTVAKSLNAVEQLKAIWPATGKRMSKFNEMFQVNYPNIGTVDNLGEPVIAPGFGFQVKNTLITLTPNGITIGADALGIDCVDPSVEKYVIAVGIVILRQSTNPLVPKFTVLRIRSGQASVNSDEPISLTCPFGASDLSAFQTYTDKKVFLTLLTLDATGNTVNHSEQFKS